MAVLGAIGTISLAFIVPFTREDAIAIIACRQGVLKDKFSEFGQLLKIPQVLITCFMYISVSLVLYSGGLIYNSEFIKVFSKSLLTAFNVTGLLFLYYTVPFNFFLTTSFRSKNCLK